MTLWLIMTVMTSAAAVWLSVPLARRFNRPPTDAAGNIAVYRDQLREIESELQQGAIDDGQAKTAGVEIKRRILAAAGSEPGAMPSLSSDERKFAIICVTGFVVLGSTGLYAITGNPDLPSMPGSRAAQSRATSFSSSPSAPPYFSE